MNTKNDPEKDNLPVNNEETVEKLQSLNEEASPKTEEKVTLDPPIEATQVASNIAEKEIESVPDKVVHEDVKADKTNEPEAIDTAIQEKISVMGEGESEEQSTIDMIWRMLLKMKKMKKM